MRKNYLLLVLAFMFFVGTSVYAISNMNKSYIYGTNVDDVDWELEVKIMTGSSEPRAATTPKPKTPVQIYQNYLKLKIVFFTNQSTTIKIKDNKGKIVCQRQFTADNTNHELEISTVEWNSGKYHLTITNSAGIDFAMCNFNVN